MEKHRDYLDGRYVFNVIRDSIGYGEVIALTPLFRALKLQNPKIYTILSTRDSKLKELHILMKGQPYPDEIVECGDKYKKYAEAHNLPYQEIDLTNVNYRYEQEAKPMVIRSRARVYMDVVGIPGDSKPFYNLLEEDLLWVEKQKLPPWFVAVQLKGAEPYKYCDEETLRHYCKAIKYSPYGLNVVIIDGEDKVKWPDMHSVVPPDIRKAIALVAYSRVTIGFDSLFQQITAALDTPYLGLLGPTSCTGRQADHKYAAFLRSNVECEPCFRESLSTCRITGERDKSACIYNISSSEMVKAVIDLKNAKDTNLTSAKKYLPGEYYNGFDPLQKPFTVETGDMTKIHQPVHTDESYAAESQQERVEWLIKKAAASRGVLDIGCANGYIIDRMPPPESGFRHCGIDIDGDRIRVAKKTKSGNIDFYQMNVMLGLPFKDNSFSTVILAEVLEHVEFEDAKKILKEAHRIAINKVLITMPFYDEAYKDDRERKDMVEDKDHKWFVSMDKLEKLFEGYDYSIEYTKFALIEIKKYEVPQDASVPKPQKRSNPQQNDRVSITLITRNRLEFFLQCFASLLAQTFKEWDCVIIDDSDEPIENKEETVFLTAIAKREGHGIKFITKQGLGICQAWQRGLEEGGSEFGYRMEDDVWFPANYFSLLYPIIIGDENIAAVGGLSPYHLDAPVLEKFAPNAFYHNKGNLIPFDRQCSIVKEKGIFEVCHLHGLFLYRKKAVESVGGFSTHMTRVAHRDETDLTLRLWFSDYKLLVCTEALHWHAIAQRGGSRDDLTVEERVRLQEADEAIFQRRLMTWRKEHPEKQILIENF